MSCACRQRVLRSQSVASHVLALERSPSLLWSAFWLPPSLLPRVLAVTCEHTLGRLEFAELAGEFLALGIDARKRFAEPLLLLGHLV